MAIGRTDPAACGGDDGGPLAGSSKQAPAIEPRLALTRHAQDEIVAGHMRESHGNSRYCRILARQVPKLLSQPGVRSPCRPADGARGALPQGDRAVSTMAADLDGETRILAARKDKLAPAEPALRLPRDPAQGEMQRIRACNDCCLDRRDRHPAGGNRKVGRTGRAVRAARSPRRGDG